jgi:hypothetical protein
MHLEVEKTILPVGLERRKPIICRRKTVDPIFAFVVFNAAAWPPLLSAGPA